MGGVDLLEGADRDEFSEDGCVQKRHGDSFSELLHAMCLNGPEAPLCLRICHLACKSCLFRFTCWKNQNLRYSRCRICAKGCYFV